MSFFMALTERKRSEVIKNREWEMRIMDYKKRLKELIKQLRSMGIKVVRTRNSHYKVFAPKGIVICSGTSRCRSTYQSTLSMLRRNGCEV